MEVGNLHHIANDAVAYLISKYRTHDIYKKYHKWLQLYSSHIVLWIFTAIFTEYISFR